MCTSTLSESSREESRGNPMVGRVRFENARERASERMWWGWMSLMCTCKVRVHAEESRGDPMVPEEPEEPEEPEGRVSCETAKSERARGCSGEKCA